MIPSAITQHRVKHFDLLLARELVLIEREHLQNLVVHQKLENTIRRDNNQSTNNNRHKLSLPLNHEHIELLDDHKLRPPNGNNDSNRKRLLSNSTGSNISQNQTIMVRIDHLNNDKSRNVVRRRRLCTKPERLPPIVKTNKSNRPRRDNKSLHWMTSSQRSSIHKDDSNEPFRLLNEESSKAKLPEITPLQRQVRSFLDTLPTYKDIQNGFDSFGRASVYSNRPPVVIG